MAQGVDLSSAADPLTDAEAAGCGSAYGATQHVWSAWGPRKSAGASPYVRSTSARAKNTRGQQLALSGGLQARGAAVALVLLCALAWVPTSAVGAPLMSPVVTATDGVDLPDCGNSTHPCRSLAHALARVTSGGWVLLKPGPAGVAASVSVVGLGAEGDSDYTLATAVAVPSMVVTVASASGDARPLVRCTGGTRAFEAMGTTQLSLRNLTVAGCGSLDAPGGVVSANGTASVDLEGCVLTANSASNGGVAYAASSSTVSFKDCEFTNNVANVTGGVAAAEGSSQVTVADSVMGRPGFVYPHCDSMPWLSHSGPDPCDNNNTAVVIDMDNSTGYGSLFHASGTSNAGTVCRWALRVPEGHGVRLDFCDEYTDLLFFFDPCSGEQSLTVTDGASGAVLFDGCGTMLPILTPSNVMYVTYRSSEDLFFTPMFVGRFTATADNQALAAGSGGAFAASGTAKLQVASSQFWGGSAWTGGAVYGADESQVTLTNVTFTGGSARTGALISMADNSSLAASGLVALDGLAAEGPGLFMSGGSQGVVQSSLFNNLVAAESGGVSIVDATTLLMDNVTFSENRVNFHGAGLGVSGSSVANLTRCRFLSNKAVLPSSFGAAVQLAGTARLNMADSIMTSNYATQGGAFGIGDSAVLTAERCTFSGNTGERWGGVLYLKQDSVAIFRYCDVLNNRASNGKGGVVNLLERAQFYASHSTLRGNFARLNGGVAQMSEGAVYMHNCTLSDNYIDGLGGAVFSLAAYSTVLDVTDCYFSGNKATVGQGAVLYVRVFSSDISNSYSFRRCHFETNKATSSAKPGGLMYIEGQVPVVFEDCVVKNSEANVGAAISLGAGVTFTCTNSVFTGNKAAVAAGVLQAVGSSSRPVVASFSDCSFTGNQVPDTGGQSAGVIGIEDYVTVHLNRCNFTDNSAPNGAVMTVTTDSGGATVTANECNFLGNAASSFSGAGGVVQVLSGTTVPVSLTIGNCTLSHNSAASGGVFSLSGQAALNLSRSTLEWNSASTEGGVLESTMFAATTVLDSTFAHNAGDTGGVFFIGTVSKLEVVNSSFTSNQAREWGGGGVVSIGRHATATLVSSTAHNNSAADGAVIYSTLDATVTAKNCDFSRNEARAGGAVAAAYTTSSQTLQACTLDQNTAVIGGVMTAMQQSSVNLKDCVVTNNVASSGGVGFGTNAASFSVDGCTFRANEALQQGGVFVAQSAFTLDIHACNFTGSHAVENGGVLDASGMSVVTISDSYMATNVATEGGAAVIHQDARMTATGSVFEGNSGLNGGALWFMGSSVSAVTNCSIGHNSVQVSGGGLGLHSSAKVVLTNVSVSGNHAASGGAIWVGDESYLKVTKGSFVDNVADTAGGAVYGRDASTTMLVESLLKENAGAAGGAVFAQNVAHFTLQDCEIMGNRAVRGGAIKVTLLGSSAAHTHQRRLSAERGETASVDVAGSMVSAAPGGVVARRLSQQITVDVKIGGGNIRGNSAQFGGVVLVEGRYSKTLYTYINVTDASVGNNYASQGGGVLYWEMLDHPQLALDSPFDFLFDCTTFNNTAAFHGDTVATGPTRLFVTQVATGPVHDTLTPLKMTMNSGTPIANPIRVVAVDNKNNPISGATLNLLVRVSVSPETLALYPNTKVYGQTLNSGAFAETSFTTLTIEGPPGQDVKIVFSALEPDHLADAVATVHLSGCVVGEYLAQLRCVPCDEGFYSWEADTVTCKQCPPNAVCPGGAVVIAQATFWRPDRNFTEMIPCPNPTACLGAEPYGRENPDAEGCLEGYTGNLCGACVDGYAHSDRLTCSECPDDASNIMVLAGVLLAAAVVAVVVVQIQRHIGKKGMDVMTMVVKILTSYYQFVSVANSLDVFWPPAVLDLFSLQSSITSAGGRLMFLECLLKRPGRTAEEVFYGKSLLYILVAPAMALVSVLFWGAVYLYRRRCRRNERRTATELQRIGTTNATVTIIVILFLLHPSVTVKVLELVTCVEVVPNSGELFLQSELDIACYTTTHVLWLVFAALPAFVFIVAGVPLAAFFLLRSLSGSLNEDFVKEKYGFLFLGYSRRCYYWEIVIVARKVAIILAAELLAQFGFLVQILGALTVTFVAHLTHVAMKPYVNEKLDRLDKTALLISLATFALGAFLKADDVQEWVQLAVAGTIIVANLSFLIFVGIYVRNELVIMLKDSWTDVMDIFRGCPCGACCGRSHAKAPSPHKAETLDDWTAVPSPPMGRRRPTGNHRNNPLVMEMSEGVAKPAQAARRGAAPAHGRRTRRQRMPVVRKDDPAVDSCVL